MGPRQQQWDRRAGEAASFEGQFLHYGEPECPGEAS